MKHKVCLFLLTLMGSWSMAAEGPPPLSILWILDNSGSLAEKREAIAKAMPQFFETLQARGVEDIRMAVSDTDYFSQKGELFVVPGTESQVISRTSFEDPVAAMQKLVREIPDSITSFWEQGLESAYHVIQNAPAHLIEPHGNFAVIYVTDEDDYSCESNCFGREPENNPDWVAYPLRKYIDQFDALEAGVRGLSVHPIVGLPSGSCQVASYGLRYLDLARAVSPSVGGAKSICIDEIESSLMSLAEDLAYQQDPIKPPVWVMDPVRLTLKVDEPNRVDLSVFVRARAGDPLTYTISNAPGFVSFSSLGLLSATPGQQDIGKHVAEVRACDLPGNCATAALEILVVRANGKPVWTQDPLIFKAEVGKRSLLDLRSFVVDPDGDKISLSSFGAPTYYTALPNGALFGTPKEEDIGSYYFRVVASDGQSRSVVNVKLEVVQRY